MSPEQFVDQILVKRLSAREVWVGPEFRFRQGPGGRYRRVAVARRETSDSAPAQIEPVHVDGERVSSSPLRAAACRQAIWTAPRTGWVAAMRSTARSCAASSSAARSGYPTANLRLMGKRTALTGIYATWVHGVGPAPRASVSSLGTRPTVLGTEPLLEAHLFDFDGDLYGRRLRVEFVAKLRDEEKFDDLPALVRQMNIDAEQARKILPATIETNIGVSA